MASSQDVRRQPKTPQGAFGREEARGTGQGPSAPSAQTETTSRGTGTETMLEQMLERHNMLAALKRVEANRGAPGIDGMETKDLRQYIRENWERIRLELLAGTYRPMPVRRVEIPKPEGGVRLLGIPICLDRLLQQALSQVLTPIFDPHFSEWSYAFRPGRGLRSSRCSPVALAGPRDLAGNLLFEAKASQFPAPCPGSLPLWKRKFLGFSFYNSKTGPRVRLAPKTVQRLQKKLRDLTKRSRSMSMTEGIRRLNSYLGGWMGYFALADAKELLRGTDEWLRRRLRQILWKAFVLHLPCHSHHEDVVVDPVKELGQVHIHHPGVSLLNEPLRRPDRILGKLKVNEAKSAVDRPD